MVGRVFVLAGVLSGFLIALTTFSRSLPDLVPLYAGDLIAYSAQPPCTKVTCTAVLTLIDRYGKIYDRLTVPSTSTFMLAAAPRQRHIAYSDGLDVYLLDPSFKFNFRMTPPTSLEGAPAWSPSGHEIAYISYADNAMDFNRFDIDTLRLTTTPLLDYIPLFTGPLSWSSSGRFLFFEMPGSTIGRIADIFVIDLQSGSLTNITNTTTRDADPAWSQQGDQIAYVANTEVDPQIVLASLDSDEWSLRQLTTNEGGKFEPTWVLDDTAIVYLSYDVRGSSLQRYDLATGVDTTITTTRPIFRFDVSPDRTQAIYISGNAARTIDLCIVTLRDAQSYCLNLPVSSDARLAWID